MLGLPTLQVLGSRLMHAAFSFPDITGLRNVLLCGAVVNAAVIGLGVSSGIYRWQPLPSPRALGWSAAYLTMRTVMEEVIFRGLLLPNPKADGVQAVQPMTFMMHAALPLVAFVFSHMWTTQRLPGTVLQDVQFLATVSVCGLACTWAYWVTSGGLWAAMLMHFLVVYPWMTLLGGYRKTHTPTPLVKRPGGGRGIEERAPAEDEATAKMQ